MNPEGNWIYHDVVVLNGLVFDSFTGPAGMPMAQYMSQFVYSDAIAMVPT